MDLVAKEATLFDVIGTLFTAVTFHELFKEAALNGNEKLEFGIQWQEVLSELQASMTAVDDCSSYDEAVLRARFDEIDSSGDGSLDEDELLQVFEALGSPVTPNLIANLIRLADDDGAFLLNCSTGPAGLVRHSKRNAFVLTPLLPSSGNGTIEWPEFLKIFQVLERMEEKEKQKRLAGGFDDAAGAVKPTGQSLKVPA